MFGDAVVNFAHWRRSDASQFPPRAMGGSLVMTPDTGVLCCQFVNYFTWYRDDKRGLKAAVAGLCLLTILKTIQVFVIIWTHAVVHFDDLQGAIQLNFSTWWEAGNPLMVAVIGFYVQSYFCYRLYGARLIRRVRRFGAAARRVTS
ncbi:hypothetical protein C8R47DRAFT_1205526 [Mycena vitilis]|nr:hypothetical protein C8R47DRAFT_1205526 [Mycena vitilis]